MKPSMIALYIRLSLEDEAYDSMSIENQELLLAELYKAAIPWPLLSYSNLKAMSRGFE